MRRARSSQSAVHCPASSLAAPSGADSAPSNMDSVEEAGTTPARPDNIIARLQTLEAADQRYLWLSTCAAVWSTAWLEIPPTRRTGRPVTVFHNGGLMPYVRFVDSVSPPVDCGICFCRSSHARPIHSPTLCWSIWWQFHWCSLLRSSHTLGLKQERGLGGWNDRWSTSCANAKALSDMSPSVPLVLLTQCDFCPVF